MIGGRGTASTLLAALANGASAHAREMDEMFYYAGAHFGCAVVPAMMSLAHEADLDLGEVYDALIVGTEVMARVGIAMNRSHPAKGWHSTSTLGVIAAAAACGRLLGFDPNAMLNGLSLAVSMAAGPKIQFGVAAKPLHAGLAAHDGILAAKLAASGVQGNPHALEGKHGFGELYGGDMLADWTKVTPAEGDPLAIESHGLAFKRYPNCASTHRCLDALHSLILEHDLKPHDVQRIEARVGKVNMLNLKYPEPRSPKEAMFSMQFALATMLRYRNVTLADFTPQAIADERTKSLMPLIEMQLHPSAASTIETGENLFAHTVIVTLRNGQCLEREVQYAKGMMRNPFTEEERKAKFDQCTQGILPEERIELVRSALTNSHAKIRHLMALLQFDAVSDDGERFQRAGHCAH